ncbi:hypothetical protein QYZ88_003335 [Lachnospiraceae bacterium C1.1]|nr:hypothetical protein [Lachnospiraceae bacterium C1.1]
MNKKIKKIVLIITAASILLIGTGLNTYAAVVNNGRNKTGNRTTEAEETGEEVGEELGEEPVEGEAVSDSTSTGLVDISEISKEQSEQIRKKTGYNVNEPLDNSVPVLYSYEIEGDGMITPGEEFTMKFVVYNPGVVSKLGNVRLYISQDERLVYPAYGRTNALYFGYMNALSYAEGTITLTASKTINSSEVPIKLLFNYTDNYNTNAEFTVDANLNVSASGKLSVDSIDMPSAMYVGNNNRLRIVYRNNGLSTINNVTLHIQGDNIENQEISFGSIGSNTSMTNDAYVTLLQQGAQNVQLYFTYTDSDGVEHETDSDEYELDVRPYSESSDKNSEYLQERYRLNNQMTYGVLAVSLLVLINLIIRISLKIRKEKMEG